MCQIKNGKLSHAKCPTDDFACAVAETLFATTGKLPALRDLSDLPARERDKILSRAAGHAA